MAETAPETRETAPEISETAPDKEEQARCRVCLTPNTSLHLGIEACRACASFFKRLAVSGRRYPCRRGQGNCEATNDNKLACRRCRYEKCLAIGMKYEGPMRNMNRNAEEAEEEPSTSSQASSESNISLLERIGKEYHACMKRRRVKELELVRAHNLARLPHPTEELYLASFDCAMACVTAAFPDLWQFFFAVFPSLEKAPYEVQREFFRLAMPFTMLDQFYRTKKIWGGFERYVMNTLLLCSDKQRPEIWAKQQQPELNRAELLDGIRRYALDQETLIVPSFEKADLNEKEIHALLALFLCESADYSDISDCYLSFVEGVREEIMKDLHQLYTTDMGLADYSTRIGSLFTVCHTFVEGNKLLKDTFRMQMTIFDLDVAETLLQYLLL